MKRSSRSKKNFIVLNQKNAVNEINNFFMNSYWSKTGIFVKLMRTVSEKWKNWRSFRVLPSTLLRELQNENHCMNDSRDFQDAESVRSGHSHVTSQRVSFPPHPILGGMLSRSLGMPSRREGPSSIFGTRMVNRETFLQIQLCLLQHCIRRNWIHGVQEYQNRFTHQRRRRMRIKHEFKIRDASLDRQPKIQSPLVRETL